METAALNPLLVQGLRPTRTGSYPWQHVLRDRLTHRFPDLDPSPTTEAAEVGLRLSKSAYWYVHRTEPAFGGVATIWSMQNPDSSQQLDSSATPFDSGGLWHGYIVVRPTFEDDEEKIAFLKAASSLLAVVQQDFQTWLVSGYPGNHRQYVEGLPPKQHLDRVVLDAGVNDSRAWTWEMRVSVADADARVAVPIEIYWSEDDYESFEAWVGNNDTVLSVRERLDLLRMSYEASVFTSHPVATLTDRLNAALV